MNLLTKLTTLVRVLVSGNKTSPDMPAGMPAGPERPMPTPWPEHGQEMPTSSETLEQTRVADLLRDQLANKEKGE